jgi:hypothetical protein
MPTLLKAASQFAPWRHPERTNLRPCGHSIEQNRCHQNCVIREQKQFAPAIASTPPDYQIARSCFTII